MEIEAQRADTLRKHHTEDSRREEVPRTTPFTRMHPASLDRYRDEPPTPQTVRRGFSAIRTAGVSTFGPLHVFHVNPHPGSTPSATEGDLSIAGKDPRLEAVETIASTPPLPVHRKRKAHTTLEHGKPNRGSDLPTHRESNESMRWCVCLPRKCPSELR